MNLVIGKIGRSLYFCKEKWGITSGDDAAKTIYFTLAKLYPQHTFYLIGANDFEEFKEHNTPKKKSKFIQADDSDNAELEWVPPNIIDLYNPGKAKYAAAMKEKYKGQKQTPDKEDELFVADFVVEEMQKLNIKFHGGLIMQGPDVTNSVGGKGILTNKGTPAIPLCMGLNYCAPIIHAINTFRFPWVGINEDPRYIPAMHNDILHDELVYLDQVNIDIPDRHRLIEYTTPFEKRRSYTQKHIYTGIEKAFMTGLEKVDFSDPEAIHYKGETYKKDIDFTMAINGSPARYDHIKRWVLKYKPDVKIYGKWDEACINEHPGVFEERRISDMEDVMFRTKFTFIAAMDNAPAFKKFVTQKVYKQIYYGIIPFWDKNMYDVDNILKEIPDYFKVATPDEMWKKINFLTSPEGYEYYKKCLKLYYNLLHDKYFNGDFIKEIFDPWITKFAEMNA